MRTQSLAVLAVPLLAVASCGPGFAVPIDLSQAHAQITVDLDAIFGAMTDDVSQLPGNPRDHICGELAQGQGVPQEDVVFRFGVKVPVDLVGAIAKEDRLAAAFERIDRVDINSVGIKVAQNTLGQPLGAVDLRVGEYDGGQASRFIDRPGDGQLDQQEQSGRWESVASFESIHGGVPPGEVFSADISRVGRHRFSDRFMEKQFALLLVMGLTPCAGGSLPSGKLEGTLDGTVSFIISAF